MTAVIITLLVLWTGWQAYRKARRDGTWSNKQFFVLVLSALALGAVVGLPIYFISPSTLAAHEGLALASIFLAIGVGVTPIIIYANRWKKRQELKRSEQNRMAGQ